MINFKNHDYKKVLIVGRPNVGKSTLFNRILNSRRSITDKTYCVTRDFIEEVCKINSYQFNLIDAGGFTLLTDEISKSIVKKVLHALKKVDLIMLVLDINEILYEDYEIIERLRKYSSKVILVLNKVDNQNKEFLVHEFHKFGFERYFLVSAICGRGISNLKDFLQKEVGEIGIANKVDIKIGIVGKPNSGKSTLINCLAGDEISIVSDKAGTTRDFIRTKFNKYGKVFELIDTSGIRRRSKVYDLIEYYSVSRALKVINGLVDIVFLLIDVKEKLTSQDKKIAHYAAKRGKGIIIVFSKWDLLGDTRVYFETLKEHVKSFFPILRFSPILKISAHKNIGLNSILKESIKLKNQLELKTNTPNLNRMLNLWIRDYHLNASHKVKYITQVSVSPVKFLLFTNKIKNFPNSYYNYLVNNLRKIGYKNIPILVELRERTREFK